MRCSSKPPAFGRPAGGEHHSGAAGTWGACEPESGEGTSKCTDVVSACIQAVKVKMLWHCTVVYSGVLSTSPAMLCIIIHTVLCVCVCGGGGGGGACATCSHIACCCHTSDIIIIIINVHIR